jgi:hypothetical protein
VTLQKTASFFLDFRVQPHKGYQANSDFSARGTMYRFVGNAPRPKFQGAPAALENRTGCLDITFSAIVAQNSIVPDTHQSRRQDMQAEAPDELEGGEG